LTRREVGNGSRRPGWKVRRKNQTELLDQLTTYRRNAFPRSHLSRHNRHVSDLRAIRLASFRTPIGQRDASPTATACLAIAADGPSETWRLTLDRSNRPEQLWQVARPSQTLEFGGARVRRSPTCPPSTATVNILWAPKTTSTAGYCCESPLLAGATRRGPRILNRRPVFADTGHPPRRARHYPQSFCRRTPLLVHARKRLSTTSSTKHGIDHARETLVSIRQNSSNPNTPPPG